MRGLQKQHKELSRALDDNERMIDNRINKDTPQDVKLEAEIEKLAKVCIKIITITVCIEKPSIFFLLSSNKHTNYSIRSTLIK